MSIKVLLGCEMHSGIGRTRRSVAQKMNECDYPSALCAAYEHWLSFSANLRHAL